MCECIFLLRFFSSTIFACLIFFGPDFRSFPSEKLIHSLVKPSHSLGFRLRSFFPALQLVFSRSLQPFCVRVFHNSHYLKTKNKHETNNLLLLCNLWWFQQKYYLCVLLLFPRTTALLSVSTIYSTSMLLFLFSLLFLFFQSLHFFSFSLKLYNWHKSTTDKTHYLCSLKRGDADWNHPLPHIKSNANAIHIIA